MKTLRSRAQLVLAGFVLSGCAANLVDETAGLEQAAFHAVGPDLDNIVISKSATPGCTLDKARLEGRGAAGGYGAGGVLTAGGHVFNTMLMGLSPLIALEDRAELENQVQEVLDGESDGRVLEWRAPKSGKVVVMKPKNTAESFRKISVPRGAEVGRTPESYAVERGTFVTRGDTPLRPSPSSASDVRIDTVPAGFSVELMGKVRGLHSETWFMVGNDGRAYGYMEPVHLMPLGDSEARPYRKSTGAVTKDTVSASVTCRDLEYSTDEGAQTVRACRSPDGKWEVNTQPGEAGASGACMPVSRTFLLQ